MSTDFELLARMVPPTIVQEFVRFFDDAGYNELMEMDDDIIDLETGLTTDCRMPYARDFVRAIMAFDFPEEARVTPIRAIEEWLSRNYWDEWRLMQNNGLMTILSQGDGSRVEFQKFHCFLAIMMHLNVLMYEEDDNVGN